MAAQNLTLRDVALLLRPDDDVAVVTSDLEAGTVVSTGTGTIVVAADIAAGHKLAVRDVPEG